MKIKYSALVSGVSGKLNGSVAASNKGGAYIRNKGVVGNPQTANQQSNRSKFGSLASNFRGLTPTEQNSWNTAAVNFPYTDKFGDVRYLSGFGLFQQLNLGMLNQGLAINTTAPEKQVFPAVLSVGALLTIDSGAISEFTVDVTFDSATTAGQFNVLMKATPSHSTSITNANTAIRNISSYPTLAAALTSFEADTDYVDIFPVPILGQVVDVEITILSPISGEQSAPFKISTPVLA